METTTQTSRGEHAGEAAKGSVRAFARQAMVVSISAGLLLYIALTTDLGAVWRAMVEAELALLVPAVVIIIVGVFFYDTWCLSILFSRLNARVGFKQLLPIKGTSYFLNTINYNAAAAGIAAFLKRRARIPFLEGASSMLLLNIADLVAVALLIGGGLLLSPAPLAPALRTGIAWGAGAVLTLFAGSLLYWNAGLDFLVLGRLRSWSIFAAFRRASLADWGVLLTLRLGFALIWAFNVFVLMRLFHVVVPFLDLLVYTPVITFVTALPVSVAGIGTSQVVMRELYAPFAEVAIIDAYSTATIFLFVVSRLAIGYRYVGRFSRELAEDGPPEPPKRRARPGMRTTVEAQVVGR